MIIRVLIIRRGREISQCGEEDNVYYNGWGRRREAKPVYFHRLGYSHWMFDIYRITDIEWNRMDRNTNRKNIKRKKE